MLTHKFNNYLENSKNALTGIIKDKKTLLLIIILAIIISGVFYFVYNNYIKNSIIKNHSLNKEFVSRDKNTTNDVLILFFYTEWCPYCKQSMPEINKFQDYIDGKNASANYLITLTKIDCDKQSTLADKYKIEAYPTIKMIYKTKVYDYDAKPNKENLIQFMETFTHYKDS
jgi:thiol-disulfide isomerase/thioredoxin